MTDRRALLIGSWQAPGRPQPTPQKVQSLLTRWEKVLSESRFAFGSLSDPHAKPTAMQNPLRSEIIAQLEAATDIGNDTELLLFFVGHSVSEGADDIQLILGHTKDGDARTIRLSSLLREIENEQISKLVVILDTCHAGRTAQQFRYNAGEWFAMLATDDGYAFDAAFTDAVLRALETPTRRNDQRIDRREGGMTYLKVFENARGRMINTKNSDRPSQDPRALGDYGSTVILPAPRRVPTGYNPFASTRSIYARVFRLLQIIQAGPRTINELKDAISTDPVFLLQRSAKGQHKSVSFERLGEYADFLSKARFVVQPGGRMQLTESGERAVDAGQFNSELLGAIESNVLGDGLTLEFLNKVIMQVLNDMVPPTPANIRERAGMLGTLLPLDAPTRLALLLLPSTGQFLKGSADAIFPAELG